MSIDEGTIAERLDEFVPLVLRAYRTPGLNVAVSHGGRVVYRKAFGLADVASGRPMTPDTTTRSGSMAKVYTATAVMQLVERGLLALDDTVNSHVDAFQLSNPLGGRDVTVLDLMTHQAGLTGNAAGPDFVAPAPLGTHLARAFARGSIEAYGGAAPLWSAPAGERYQYSNLGIATLGYLVERLNPERLSFSDYAQRYILDPLQMTSSQFPPVQDATHVRPDLFARLCTGYSQIGDVQVGTPDVYLGDFPAGGVITTPSDHLRLLLAYANGGALDGARILEDQTVKEMLTPRLDIGVDGGRTALVWTVFDDQGSDAFFGHHGQHMWGWCNTARYFPDLETGVVVSVNHWNVLEGSHAPRVAEGDQINLFVANLVAGRNRGPIERTWAWLVSYARGLIITERTKGALGIATPWPDAMTDRMVAAAAADDEHSAWDVDGFRASVHDLLQETLTPTSMADFLRSPRCRIPIEVLPLVSRELAWYVGNPPVPVGKHV